MTNVAAGKPGSSAQQLFTPAGWRGEGQPPLYTAAQIAALVEAQQPATHVQNQAEIEHVAGDVSKNGAESNMAQQPAPSAAAAFGEAPLPLLVRDMAADLGTTPIQVCTALAQLGFGGHSVNMAVTPRMAKSLRAHFASTTPQADSQPATQQAGESVAVQWLAEMIMSDCGCSTQNQRLLDRIIERITQYERANTPTQSEGGAQAPALDAEDTTYNEWFNGEQGTAYDGMWAFARAAWMARAARAPADSVTAPAGGVSEYTPMLDDEGRAMVGTSHHYTADNIRALVAEYKALEAGGPDTWELHCNTDHRARAGVLWRVISALADEVPFAPPAQAADSVLEDAARLEQIAEAIRDYHYALDTRKHGGVAESAAFNSICLTMGMHWEQGKEADRRTALAANGGKP